MHNLNFKKSAMDTIPPEIVLHIHSFFDPETFVLSPRVCHLWKDINLVLKKKLYKSVKIVLREDNSCGISHYATSNGWKMFTEGVTGTQWLWNLKHGTEHVNGRQFIWKYGKRILEKRTCINCNKGFNDLSCFEKNLCPGCCQLRQNLQNK